VVCGKLHSGFEEVFFPPRNDCANDLFGVGNNGIMVGMVVPSGGEIRGVLEVVDRRSTFIGSHLMSSKLTSQSPRPIW